MSNKFNYEDATSELTSKVLTDEVKQEYEERLKIDPANINQCCIDHPLLVNDVYFYYEQALAEEAKYKDLIARAYATLDPEARNHLQNSGIKVTEAKVDSTIRTYDNYVLLQAIYHAAKANVGKWRALREAVNDRRFMLVQVASNFRAEGNSSIGLKNI